MGFTVNVPLSPGVGDKGYALIFDELLWPLAERYRPQLILVSAGFDAHWRDPLARMGMTVQGYHYLARTLMAIAVELCQGRLVVTLEGGYDLNALSYGMLACIRALQGAEEVEDPLGPSPYPEPDIIDYVEQLKGIHRLI